MLLCILLAAAQTGQTPPDADRDDLLLRFQPWRENYLQLVSYRPDLPDTPPAGDGARNDSIESEFQLSLRYLLAGDHDASWLGRDHALFAGYTTRTYVQTFNGEASRPFRTTDHVPELFVERDVDGSPWLFRVAPFQHLSNGEAGEASRNWNRAYVEAVWRSDPALPEQHAVASRRFAPGHVVSGMVWYPYQAEPSDNPDIHDYMGYGRLRYTVFLDRGVQPALTLTTRSNLGSGADFRGAFELDFSFDLGEVVRLHLQWFRGYGESLFEYDALVSRYGIGVELIPWSRER